MTLHTKAPDIPNRAWPKGGYPTKGKRLGPAWESIWRALERADDFLDGKELAETVAGKTGLTASTLTALMSRAAAADILEKDSRPVKVTVNMAKSKTYPKGMAITSTRTRTFYRIKK